MSRPDWIPITEEDWNNTPLAVQALVKALWEEVSALRRQVSLLQEQVSQNSQKLIASTFF